MGAYLQWTDGSGTLRKLYFDLVQEENVELVSQATESPVEDGVNVADHVKKELDRVSLEVLISQTPLIDRNGKGGRVQTVTLSPPKRDVPFVPTPGAITNAVGGAIRGLLGNTQTDVDVQVFKFDAEYDAVADTMAVLEKLRDDFTLVDVFTYRTYEKMHLEAINVIANAESGTGATLRLSFKEMRKVAVRIVAAPIPTEVRANKEKQKGKQQSKEVTGPKKTVAKGILDQIRGR